MFPVGLERDPPGLLPGMSISGFRGTCGSGPTSLAGHARARGGPRIDGLLAAAASVTGSLSAGAGALLMWRRLAGAIPAAPGSEAVLAVCGAGLVLLAVADVAVRRGCPPLAAALARVGLLLGVAAVALPLRFTPPGEAFVATAALIAAATASLTAPVGAIIRRLQAGSTEASRNAWPPARAPVSGAGAIEAGAIGSTAAADPAATALSGDLTDVVRGPASPAGDVSQWFERRTLADGCERVDGMIRVAVPQGSRLGWGHVGFCPPFTAAPAVEVTTGYDGVEATVTAAEVLPWGVRIEVRLDEPAEEPLDIPVNVAARTAA